MIASRACTGLVLALVCAQACDDGGSDAITSGASCEELCTGAAQCEQPPENASRCESDCSQLRGVWNATAWNAYSACATSDACIGLDACLQEAIDASPSTSVDRFLADVCDWAVGCAGGAISKSQCLTMFRSLGDDQGDAGAGDGQGPFDYLRLLRASLVSCVGSCVTKLSCGESDFGAASQRCASQCGLKSFDGSDAATASSGNPCVDEHGDCGDHGDILENDFGGCECQCEDGYVSLDWVCVPGCAMSGCSGHGACDPSGICSCEEGYYAVPGDAAGGCRLRPYFVDLATAERNTCGVRNDGLLECWGDSFDGVLELPEPNQGFVSVSIGGDAAGTGACALRDDGSYACWGDIVQPTEALAPALASVYVDGDAACGVEPDDSVYCWGFSPYGATSPTETAGFRAVALGQQLACGVRLDGTLACWGDADVVARVPADLQDVEQLCLRAGSGCVRRGDGSVECFGSAPYVSTELPVPNVGFVDVTCGDYHACVLGADGTATCWGLDVLGGVTIPQGMESGYTDLEAGDDHTCGLHEDGSIRCWGRSTYNEALELHQAAL